MRRYRFVLVAALLLLIVLAITGTALASDGAGVTVTVRIARVIDVGPSGTARSNASVVSFDSGNTVTYLAP